MSQGFFILIFPLILGFIGLFTNGLALVMLFRPFERKRYLGIPWQGIVPRNMPRFAKMIANVIENEMIHLSDIAGFIDPAVLLENNQEAFIAGIEENLDQYAKSMPEKYRAMLTGDNKRAFAEELFKQIKEQTPEITEAFLNHAMQKVGVRDHILHNITSASGNVLETLMFRLAKREFYIIVGYGGIFGALLGFVQFAVFSLGFSGWTLPISGALAGLLTNYLALVMLFKPEEPVQIGPIRLQGAIPSRADSLTENLQTVIPDFLDVGELFADMIETLTPDVLSQAMRYEFDTLLPEKAPHLAQMFSQMMSGDQKEKMIDTLVAGINERLPQFKQTARQYARENVNLAKVMQAKESYTIDEFMQFIRSMLTTEQTAVIAYGGIFGGLIGLMMILLPASG